MREVRANGTRTFVEGSPEVRDGPDLPSGSQISDLQEQPEKPGSARAKPAAKPRARRGNLLMPPPDPFPVSQKHLEYAQKKGWPEWWLRNRHEHFCDLAAAKAWRYADWDLALYGFLRNEIGYRRGPSDMARDGVPIPFARTQAQQLRQPDGGVRLFRAAIEGT